MLYMLHGANLVTQASAPDNKHPSPINH